MSDKQNMKGETMTLNDIKTAISNENVGCSVKHIANLIGVDTTSEALREIKDICWEAVESGILRCTIIEDTDEQFFSVA